MSAQTARPLPPAVPVSRRRMRVVTSPPPPPVSVVVPCHDESQGIPQLVQGLAPLAALGWEVVVVDDGSRDGTFSALLEATRTRPWMRVVRHGANLGVGTALRSGFAQARAPIVCTMDSDCRYAPERLSDLVRLIEDGADIVTACPGRTTCATSPGRRVRGAMSRAVEVVYRRLVDGDVDALTCLFRAYRRDVLDRTPFRSAGAAAVPEILVRGMLDGCRVRMVPMRRAAPRSGETKPRVGRVMLSHLRTLGLAMALGAARRTRRFRAELPGAA
jgi:dolichol-phosphate mannosyltransferase